MGRPAAASCTAEEPLVMRLLRLLGMVTLVACSLALTIATRTVIDLVRLITFLQLGVFVAALGMLASSIAAFWWREAALRRVEWAAYLGLILLIAEQFAIGPNGRVAHSVTLIFALLVVAIIVTRVTRRTRAEAAACNCG